MSVFYKYRSVFGKILIILYIGRNREKITEIKGVLSVARVPIYICIRYCIQHAHSVLLVFFFFRKYSNTGPTLFNTIFKSWTLRIIINKCNMLMKTMHSYCIKEIHYYKFDTLSPIWFNKLQRSEWKINLLVCKFGCLWGVNFNQCQGADF